MRRAVIPGLALATLAGLAFAQTPPANRAPQQGTRPAPASPAPSTSPAPNAASVPNLQHGRQLAEAGNQNGAVPCAQCHGLNGVGNAQSGFPDINAQPAYYLYKQLNDYASGARKNPIMGPIAQALSDAERQDVAAYYGSLGLVAPATPASASDKQAMEAASALVAYGSAERGIQACVNCHGPDGTGLGPTYPRIAGQYATYARAQFGAFRDGSRQNDVAAVMREITRRLSDDEVKALSSYLEAAHPARLP